MPSIQKNNRAAGLLAQLDDTDGLSIERLAFLIGIKPDELRACRDQGVPLTPAVQLKMSRAISARIPRLASRARRLEEQAVAAARLETGQTAVHLIAPAKW